VLAAARTRVRWVADILCTGPAAPSRRANPPREAAVRHGKPAPGGTIAGCQ